MAHVMKRELIRRAKGWAWMASSLLPFFCGGAQFLEISADIEVEDWNYWFFCDRIGKYAGQEGIPSIFTTNQTRRCVVGAKTWMIESDLPKQKVTRWFTGTNIIEHTVITQETLAAEVKILSERSGFAMTGHKYTRVHPSAEGNPGRPVRVADLMGFDLVGRLSWLAFCSGPALQQEGRRIFPPSDLWKESTIACAGWTDVTEVFKDNLGLPRSISLVFTNSQPICQYQVRRSTNVLGWDLPLEFYGVQYLPAETN